jgi:hypothetical protein
LEDRSEMEIERKVGVKVSELMKEIDQIITFLRALNDDVGLRFNKLLAQVDNMTAPLTNAVIKMEEVTDQLTSFRESAQKVLGAAPLSAQQSAQGKVPVSLQTADMGDVAKQVAAIRDETSKALEAVRMISEATKKVPTGKGAGEVQLPQLGEVTEQMSTIKEAGLEALQTIRNLEEATKRVQREMLSSEASAARAATQTPARQPTPATQTGTSAGGPPISSSTPTERKTTPPPAPTAAPAPPPSKPVSTLKSRSLPSSVEPVFQPVEEAINSNAGAVAKAILDARDKIMNMTRKFGAIYELASAARDLARTPERPLDRKERDAVMEKVASWKQKLSDALSSS